MREDRAKENFSVMETMCHRIRTRICGIWLAECLGGKSNGSHLSEKGVFYFYLIFLVQVVVVGVG